jgi:hypothetical protein
VTGCSPAWRSRCSSRCCWTSPSVIDRLSLPALGDALSASYRARGSRPALAAHGRSDFVRHRRNL